MQIQSIFIQKFYSTAIVLFLFSLLEYRYIANLYVLLGLGHFGITYLYQFYSGKITEKYILWHTVLMLFFFLLAFLYLRDVQFTTALLGLTAIYFLVHFIIDENYLFGRTITPQFAANVAPVFFLYIGFVLLEITTKDFFPNIFFILGIGSFFLYMFLALLGKVPFYRVETYFFLMGFILMTSLAIGIYLPLVVLFGSIVLFHYMSWYIFYFMKVKDRAHERTRYIKNVFVVNAIFITLYFLFTSNAFYGVSIFGFFFAPTYFYLWTILHLVFSTRVAEYKSFFGRLRSFF